LLVFAGLDSSPARAQSPLRAARQFTVEPAPAVVSTASRAVKDASSLLAVEAVGPFGQSCEPVQIAVGESTVCTVTVTNESVLPANVNVKSKVSSNLTLLSASGAVLQNKNSVMTTGSVPLAARVDLIPTITAVDPASTPSTGFFPLEDVGYAAMPIRDEQALNFSVPAFSFGGQTFDAIGVVSNGYIVLGGTQGNKQIQATPQSLPNVAAPNGVLAPYWTDLDGSGSPGIRLGKLSDGAESWLIVQWDVHLAGDNSPAGQRSMQVWIGLNGTTDVVYHYRTPGQLAAPGAGLTIGAENPTGTAGDQASGTPASAYRVTATPAVPGGSLTYTVTIAGKSAGTGSFDTTASSNQVSGVTRMTTAVAVV